MVRKPMALLLLLSIFFGLILLVFVLDFVGLLQAREIFPFLQETNPVKLEDKEYPSEMEKLNFRKWEEKLVEKEEELARKEAELGSKSSEVEQMQRDIDEMKNSLQQEKTRLQQAQNDRESRAKKINDLANKVLNMPPEKAVEMMVNWQDFDVMDVFKEIDKIALEQGTSSLTPYLLTLFTPERRAEITRKMLVPPLESAVTTAENQAP